jgi:hypothetical protein
MAYEGLLDDVRKAIALEKPSRLPAFACSEEFDVKWYGKWDYETLCRDGDKIAEAWIAAIDEFDYDWAWVQIDDCFEFEPLGVGYRGGTRGVDGKMLLFGKPGSHRSIDARHAGKGGERSRTDREDRLFPGRLYVQYR